MSETPVETYDGFLRIVAEDDKHRYVLSYKGHITKLRRKTCFLCPDAALYVIIFNHPRHNRVERFCKNHATNYGELPDAPQLEESELTNKQKLAIQAMQKWNNISVKM